jgi:hypothetical protein
MGFLTWSIDRRITTATSVFASCFDEFFDHDRALRRAVFRIKGMRGTRSRIRAFGEGSIAPRQGVAERFWSSNFTEFKKRSEEETEEIQKNAKRMLPESRYVHGWHILRRGTDPTHFMEADAVMCVQMTPS